MARRRRHGREAADGGLPSARLSRARILAQLRAAARKGDRTALTLAVEQMRTLALSPRYWAKYLALLRSPLARLVDLLVIKQGERIAHQKGWRQPGLRPASPPRRRQPRAPGAPRTRPRRAPPALEQPTLFDL